MTVSRSKHRPRIKTGVPVLIVGDPCLDENVYGCVDAVAKEAPVVALEAAERVFAPGQATNVAANAAALGARVSFVGVGGPGESFDRLVALLTGFGVAVEGLVAEPGRVMTHKIKYVSREAQRHRQHLLHVYWQERRPPRPATMKAMRAAAGAALVRARALVLSDYGNGTLTPGFTTWLVAVARRRRIITVANARGDLRKFKAVTLVVGNREELSALGGGRPGAVGGYSAAMASAATRLGVRYLVITAGDEGMYIWPVRGRARHLPSAAREVVDVTGAGDTVTAALAVALASGASLEKAGAFANAAAAAAVAREGTAAPRAY